MANPFQEAIGDTEREILDFAFDRDAPDKDRISRDNGDELIAEGSQVQGWDYGSISDEEIAIRNIQGDDADPNYIGDKPGQYQYELDVDRENAALRAQIQQREAEVAQWRAQYDPQVKTQAEINRADFLDQHGLVAVDDQKANALFGYAAGLQQQNQQFMAMKMHESENRIREEYGHAAVNEALETFKQLPPNSPVTQNIKATILGSPNPGETFMALMDDSSLVNSLRPEPPFARTREPDSRPTRWPSRSDNEENFNSGYGDQNVEQLIWNETWK